MALVRTSLTAAIKASDLLWNVASTATGFPLVGTVNANQPVMVDDEVAFITGVPVTGQVVVRGRGSDGSLAVPHDINAVVITSSNPGDFPAAPPAASTVRPQWAPALTSYGQDGAIAVPVETTTVFLTKATAGAFTLGAPSLAVNGIHLVITSQTAAAHVITATSLFDTGVATPPFSTATFAAQPGASLFLIAQNGLWNLAAANAVTFT